MRYLFHNIVDGYSAMVSSHGYFFINKGKQSAVYSRWVYESGVYDEKDNRLPIPEYVYEGKVSELGIKYLPEEDDIDLHDYDEIKKRLIKFIKNKVLNKH